MFLTKHRRDRAGERGQILVIVAAGFVVIMAMVGLAVDGGFAWGQQRHTQNAADAASEAGALVIASNILGATKTDADVASAIASSIAENSVSNPVNYYTDIDGTLLTPAGATTGSESQAAVVGDGVIPLNASGVRSVTSRQFQTFLARVIGVNTLTTTTSATAVAGYVSTICPAANGCGLLPITIPVNQIVCDAGKPVTVDANNDGRPDEWPYFNVEVVIPLCGTGAAGNVGWLDWTPTDGGTSELISAIQNPSNPEIHLPSWQYMTTTGNVNSSDVENAINYYAANGIPVQMPRFDSTCDEDPPPPNPNPDPGNEPCPPGHSGTGQNNWYHLPSEGLVTFLFDSPRGAWITGNAAETRAACGDAIVQGGATGCLKGQFIGFTGPGTVAAAGTGPPQNSAVGVQLIR